MVTVALLRWVESHFLSAIDTNPRGDLVRCVPTRKRNPKITRTIDGASARGFPAAFDDRCTAHRSGSRSPGDRRNNRRRGKIAVMAVSRIAPLINDVGAAGIESIVISLPGTAAVLSIAVARERGPGAAKDNIMPCGPTRRLVRLPNSPALKTPARTHRRHG
jgi:hypothetical protein